MNCKKSTNSQLPGKLPLGENHNTDLLRAASFVAEHYHAAHFNFEEENLDDITVGTIIKKAQANYGADPVSAVSPII